jgi:hypothetical protein
MLGSMFAVFEEWQIKPERQGEHCNPNPLFKSLSERLYANPLNRCQL